MYPAIPHSKVSRIKIWLGELKTNNDSDSIMLGVSKGPFDEEI